MHFLLYFTFLLTFFFKYIQSNVIRKNDVDLISNNIDTLINPLRKIYGLFPNREFEMQFDFEQVNYDGVKGNDRTYPTHSIMRTKNVSEASTNALSGTLTSADPGKQVVYMDDLKKALEEFEKKHSEGDCNKKAPTIEPFSLSSLQDNPSLSDVVRLIKKGAILQNYTPKTGDGGFSWVKIKVPAK